jgi:hypothetical protein
MQTQTHGVAALVVPEPVLETAQGLMALGALYMLEHIGCTPDSMIDIYQALVTLGQNGDAPLRFDWREGAMAVVVIDLPLLVERAPEVARTLGRLRGGVQVMTEAEVWTPLSPRTGERT